MLQQKNINVGNWKAHHQLVSTYSETEPADELLRTAKFAAFGVTVQVPYTDVWMHKPVQYYPGNIRAQTAENVSADNQRKQSSGRFWLQIFYGGWVHGQAAMAPARCAIGVELETERFEQTVREVQDLVSQNG